MRGKKDLFQLIHSLSKSEKRYFTIDAQKSGRKSSRYLDLFHRINKQEEYDETPLKKKFGRSLADDKVRLYEAILRSLRDYRSAKSHAAQIKEHLVDAHFLYERGLYAQCEERLLLAKELAEELGDYLSVLEINNNQRRILRVRAPNDLKERIFDLIEEKNNIEKYLELEGRFLDLYDRLFMKISQFPQKLTSPQKEAIQEEFDVLINVPAPSSIEAEIRFHLCRFFYFKLLDRQKMMYEAAEELIHCWDKSPKLKDEKYYLYITHVANLLHAAFMDVNANKDKINQLLASLDEEVPRKFQSQRQQFEAIALYKILYHINTGDVAQIEQTVEKIEAGLETYQISPGRELAILFNTSIALFISQEFRACNYWILKIIDSSRLTNLRQDLLPITKILQVVLAYELNDLNFFESYHRSAYRFFKNNKNESLKGLDKVFLGDSKKLFYASKREQAAIFTALKEKIKALPKNIPGGLDQLILLWIDAKTSHKTIPILIQESLDQS